MGDQDLAQRQQYGGIPHIGEDPSPAEWARISHHMGMNLISDVAAMAELARLFRFQGMDPARIIQRVHALGTEAGRIWTKDVAFLISLHICRGTKVVKILKSVSQDVEPVIRELQRVYQITDAKPRGDDITLARLALCFPLLTLRQLEHFQDQMTVRHHTMQALSPGYPLALMHPAFASLVSNAMPNEQDTQDMLDAHRLYLVELTKVINPGLRTKPIREIADSFEQPLMAGYGSTFTDEANRKQSLKKLGVVTPAGELIQEVRNAAAVFRQLLG
nr:nucleocapsid protein [Dabieshan tick virus]BDX23338.1 nucleocapsid protein [Dabieshan tick virus]